MNVKFFTVLLWSIIFSNHIACAHPLHTTPLHLARESPFVAITIHDCYDGDTCTATLHDRFLPPVLGEHIPIRLAGIDTPEIHGHCLEEIRLAVQARNFLRTIIARATRIDLIQPERDKYFRLRGTLLIDGHNAAAQLIAAGLARSYNGGARLPWCAA